MRLFDAALVGLYPLPLHEANDWLERWGHKLGRCERPFHSQAFVLELDRTPIAVAISASSVGAPVAGYSRSEIVELARLGSCTPWANRVMLRLWREVCAPTWPCWEVRAAISYSMNAMHPGDMYRFDGWEKVREDCGSGGGGSWSTRREAGDVKRGAKSLWIWRYSAARDDRAHLRAVTPLAEPQVCPK